MKKEGKVTVRTRCKFDDFIMDGDDVVGIVCREGYRFNAKLQSDDLENKTGKTKYIRAKMGVMLAAGASRATSGSVRFRTARCPEHRLDEPAGCDRRRPHQGPRIGATPVQLCWLQFLPVTATRVKRLRAFP